METWIPIPEFPKYEISDKMRVRNLRTGALVKTHNNQTGTIYVSLFKDSKQYVRGVWLLKKRMFGA